jgi:uncharacterized protein
VKGLLLGRVIFLALLLPLMFLAQRFWFTRAWRIIGRIGRPQVRKSLQGIWGLAAGFVAVTFADSVFGLLPRSGAWGDVLVAAKFWLAISLFGYLGVKLVHALEWGLKQTLRVAASPPDENLDKGRREFFKYAAYAAGSLPFFAGAYGFAEERLNFHVEKVEIPIAGLPEGLDGLRIAQLSDIHASEFMPIEDVRRAVQMANALRADMAVVTGDFITGHKDPLAECIAELSALEAPLGVWGCNGNHEIYARAEEKAQQLFAQYGMRLLRHENAELAWRGAKFNLIGVDYQRERTVTGKKLTMLKGIEPLVRGDVPNILLSHNPNSFPRAAEAGIELMLAGHTHGGQVRVEIVDRTFTPASFYTRFVAGPYQLPAGTTNGDGGNRTSRLYVNRGLGTIGMPVRLGVPPEITLVTLRKA